MYIVLVLLLIKKLLFSQIISERAECLRFFRKLLEMGAEEQRNAFDAVLSRIVCSTYVDLLKRFRGLSEADLWTD